MPTPLQRCPHHWPHQGRGVASPAITSVFQLKALCAAAEPAEKAVAAARREAEIVLIRIMGSLLVPLAHDALADEDALPVTADDDRGHEVSGAPEGIRVLAVAHLYRDVEVCRGAHHAPRDLRQRGHELRERGGALRGHPLDVADVEGLRAHAAD